MKLTNIFQLYVLVAIARAYFQPTGRPFFGDFGYYMGLPLRPIGELILPFIS